MASFRTGFKIFGEISLKQGLGRIRSFSEDRKPGHWLPEDQWAVRQPGSTCPDPCEKKKPPKPSKSWLSICRDPPKEIECDVRHNNCPPVEVKEDVPWYSLDNFIPKKKPDKPPPLHACREEMRRKELAGDDEVCENIKDPCFPEQPRKPEPTECCMPKSEPCPAPVVTLSCPLPKELNISLWCERPCSNDTSRIPIPCQTDRLPYDEFRPQKSWKPTPFSLPKKSGNNDPVFSAGCYDTIPYSEFKQVDVPRPLYTRYKSVDLTDKYLMLCMTDVKCPDDSDKYLATENLPVPLEEPCFTPPEQEVLKPKQESFSEKPLLEAGSCKPVRLKKAPKYTFRPKPTKLVERVVRQNPFPNKSSDLLRDAIKQEDCTELTPEDEEPPKVITGNLTNEPPKFEREAPLPSPGPPRWMYLICKPGAKKTPLVPCENEPAKEPDKCEETDGLNFYDGNDEMLTPKPAPDPCKEVKKLPPPPPPEEAQPAESQPPPVVQIRNRFVLMPPEYRIKYSRQLEDQQTVTPTDSSTFEKFIEVKTTKKTSKSYPPMKENILYDLQRLCPNPPLDPSKLSEPCRKPPSPPCSRPPQFYPLARSFSTFHPSTLGKLRFLQLNQIGRRTECDDTSGKCKARELVPRPKPCPEPIPKPDCASIALPCCPKAKIPPECDAKRPLPPCKKKLPPRPSFSECSKDPPPCPRPTECNCWDKKTPKALNRLPRGRTREPSKVKCFTLQPAQNTSNGSPHRVMLGLSDSKDDPSCDYEQRSVVTKSKTSKTKERKDPWRNYSSHHRKNPQIQKDSFVAVEEQDFAARAGIRDEDFGQVNSTSLSLRDSNFLEEKQNEEKIDRENSVTFYSSPERNEENSKAFMESLGSWINDLFNVPTKTSSLKKESGKEKKVYQETVPDEDPDYMKSISAIKEQFRKKLKSETSIQVSTPEKPFTSNFDRDLENKAKTKKSKSLPRTPPTDWLQDLNVFEEQLSDGGENPLRRCNPPSPTGLIIRTNDLELDNVKELNGSILLKEKKRGKGRERQEISELEEYVFPTPSELSKRILLNVSENDKCSKYYKNSHLGVQDSQHYGQRKNKSHQTNARCYTTNANLIEATRHSVPKKETHGNCHKYCSTTSDVPATTVKTDETQRRNQVDQKKNFPRRPTKREISEITRDVISFTKLGSQKLGQGGSLDSTKADKTSSDELVKYLMKKIKTTPRDSRTNTPRVKHSTNVPQVVTTTKNRLMQSATNTLVNVMAKGESQLPVKASNRLFPETRSFPSRELILKRDANMRVDVSRAISVNKYSRLTYLLEDTKFEDDLLENTVSNRYSKRNKRNWNKFNKRLEVKNMLTKIDDNDAPMKKTKEKKKPETPPMYVKEEQNARFQKQHELFRTNLKSAQLSPEPTEAKNEEHLGPANATCSSTELAVIEPGPQISNSQEKAEETEKATPDLILNTDPPSELDYEVGELLDLDVKPVPQKPDKNQKIFNSKSLNFLKDSDSKVMLSPLEKFCMCEQGPRDSAKTPESPLCPTELGQKPADTMVFNRRFSTNSLTESIPKFKPANGSGTSSASVPKSILCLSDSKSDDKTDKKEIKDDKKKKLRTTKSFKEAPTDNCGFDKDKKKPGPNCEKEE